MIDGVADTVSSNEARNTLSRIGPQCEKLHKAAKEADEFLGAK